MKAFLVTISLFISVNVIASSLGIWLVGDKDAKVEIYQNGDNLEGKLVWIKEPTETDGSPKVDKKNPDLTLRARNLIGMVFLKDFKKEKGEDKWSGGTVYDAKTGKTYSGWIKLIDANNLKLRGFVGISLLGRTDEWTKDSL